MDHDPELPRLVVTVPFADVGKVRTDWPSLAEAGSDGLLVDAGGVPSADLTGPLGGLVAVAGGSRVLLAGPPGAAGEAGSGLLLPEAGMAAAEARRQLRAGSLLGRETATIEAAALVLGVDFLVCAWDVSGARARRAIESAPVPILWRVGSPDGARTAIEAGAEGVVLDCIEDPATMVEMLRRVSALLPNRADVERVVFVDGVPVALVPETAVTDLLADLGITPSRVRRNGVAVPRRMWDDAVLSPGDVLETSG